VTGTISDLEVAILKILDKTPDVSYDNIAKELKISSERVKSVITDLIDGGFLEKKGKAIGITPAGGKVIPPISREVTEISIMYRYAMNPALPGPPVIPTTRKFCRELLSANKLYTPKEIEQIANQVDYDVFLFRGGWYHNPQTDETTPYCRHIWEQVVVSKKRPA
jgi:DNA-binding Lrp family transcriptional regulator